jgi:hypothetical protein
MVNGTTLAIVAIIAAVGLLGILVIGIIEVVVVVEAEARPVTGIKSCDFFGGAFNRSQGHCFNP